MALEHDLRCRKCQRMFSNSRVEVPCPSCGSNDVAWLVSVNVPSFTPFWHPNLGHKPVLIDSAKTLDRELGKRKLHVNEEHSRRRQRLPATAKEAKERY